MVLPVVVTLERVVGAVVVALVVGELTGTFEVFEVETWLAPVDVPLEHTNCV